MCKKKRSFVWRMKCIGPGIDPWSTPQLMDELADFPHFFTYWDIYWKVKLKKTKQVWSAKNVFSFLKISIKSGLLNVSTVKGQLGPVTFQFKNYGYANFDLQIELSIDCDPIQHLFVSFWHCFIDNRVLPLDLLSKEKTSVGWHHASGRSVVLVVQRSTNKTWAIAPSGYPSKTALIWVEKKNLVIQILF